MKKFLILLLIALPIIIFSQENIGRKVHLYGEIDEKIIGQTALRFNFQNPKVEKYTLGLLKDEGLPTLLWTSMFLPDAEYTEEEILNTLNENNVRNIIFIKLEDLKKGNYGYGTNLTSSMVYYVDIETIDFIKIKTEFYKIDEALPKRPSWLVIGEASGGSEFSTAKSVMKKIIGRIIDGLDEKGAF